MDATFEIIFYNSSCVWNNFSKLGETFEHPNLSCWGSISARWQRDSSLNHPCAFCLDNDDYGSTCQYTCMSPCLKCIQPIHTYYACPYVEVIKSKSISDYAKCIKRPSHAQYDLICIFPICPICHVWLQKYLPAQLSVFTSKSFWSLDRE